MRKYNEPEKCKKKKLFALSIISEDPWHRNQFKLIMLVLIIAIINKVPTGSCPLY